MNFLLLGLGSIGTRHRSILRDMGHVVTTVDPDPTAGADYQTVEGGPYDGVLDCTPPDVRPWWLYPQRYPVFVEKPLGVMADSTRIAAHSPPPSWIVQTGFCYRWCFTLEDFVQTLHQKGVAELHLIGGQYIQYWHKEHYKEVAHRYHGVATDSLPHSIYIARWIMGDVTYQGSTHADVGDLGLGVEDVAGVLLSGPEGQPVLLSANYLQQVRSFRITAITKAGEWMTWEFAGKDAGPMYFRQMENFAKLCQGQDIGYYPNLADGVAVQKILNEVTG